MFAQKQFHLLHSTVYGQTQNIFIINDLSSSSLSEKRKSIVKSTSCWLAFPIPALCLCLVEATEGFGGLISSKQSSKPPKLKNETL